MYLIELFLPVTFNDGSRIPVQKLAQVQKTLGNKFGGFTAFTRAPAKGAWKRPSGEVKKDAVVIVEVMSERLQQHWWKKFKKELERDLRQDEILVRASVTRRL